MKIIDWVAALFILYVVYSAHLYNIKMILEESKKESTKCGEEYIPPCNRDLISRDIVNKCYIEED